MVYPPSEHVIESRDSNFVFGSVGNGNAILTIDGTPVPVAPNGAFLAFLPLPSRDVARYDLVATVRDRHRESRLSGEAPAARRCASRRLGPLAYDSASVAPAPTVRLALRDDEMVRVAVRAPSNATVVWRGDAGATRRARERRDPPRARSSSATADPPARRGAPPAIRSRGPPISRRACSARAPSS